MKKISIIIIALSLLVLNNACTDKFDELNTSKTSLATVTPAMLFLPYLKGVLESDYQRNYNLYDDIYAQYFATTVKSFTSENYVYNNGWAGTGWEQFYTQWLPSYYGIVDNYTVDGYKNMRAIADIFICFAWQRMTDRWGDIPYTNASRGKAVPYESQQTIYADLLKRVKADCEAIDVSDKTQYNPGSYDLMYNGDYAKWKKFGYSLLLRMAVRISKVDGANAKTYAEAAYAGGLLSSNNENAWINQSASGWYDYLNNTLINWEGGTISKAFCNRLKTTSASGLDPRAELWGKTGDLGWVGFPNGLKGDNYPSDYSWKNYANINQKAYFKPGRVGGSTTAYSYMVMNYAEVLFLQAEGKLRGWNTGSDYNTLYVNAIKASMSEVGVTDADAINNYLKGLPALTGANEASFKTFMTQKWLALFPNGVEGWAEVRRTGYPLTASDYVQVSDNATVKDGNWVGRIRYVDNEHDNNATNLPSEFNTYDNDRMEKCVWWGQKNSSGVFPTNMTPVNF